MPSVPLKSLKGERSSDPLAPTPSTHRFSCASPSPQRKGTSQGDGEAVKHHQEPQDEALGHSLAAASPAPLCEGVGSRGTAARYPSHPFWCL